MPVYSCFLGAKRSRDYLKPITSSISSQIIILYYFSISLSSIEPLMDKNDNLRPESQDFTVQAVSV